MVDNKKIYIDRMIENLPVLRAKSGLTQAELAQVVGVSRQTILAAEKKQRELTWSMFLALLNVFGSNENTASLIDTFEIRPEGYQNSVKKQVECKPSSSINVEKKNESGNSDKLIIEMSSQIKVLNDQLFEVRAKLNELEIEHSQIKEELIMAMNKITSQDEIIEKIMKNRNTD
ncbi:helix-turn-helix transcriptional regulator [Ruminococcus sp. HUN007]|uniref:helix-turn-helix transcriptional regulator n=1 Tax=Ruminococcus sp. HUN007 TaxID=1514668 RepID=UPI0006797398|nr:helix-turn-helix transcriptional regulator [Ruminococcus sp. HUN007]